MKGRFPFVGIFLVKGGRGIYSIRKGDKNMDKVLRASKAGFPCMRNLWYSVNGYKENVSEKSQRIFDVGTALEPVIVEWLRQDGWNVEYNPGSQNAEIEITVPVIGGILAGHPDCIISKGDIQNVLVDIKTMNDRAFTYWKRSGTLKTKPQYVTQLHIYAMGLKNAGRDIKRLGIVGVNKNNSEMHIDFFDFDEGIAIDIQNRAELILNAKEIPEYDCPTENWACNYCEFHDTCKVPSPSDTEKIDAPLQPVIGTRVPVTYDETIINAMKALQNARELSKQARALENDAKPILDENVKGNGLNGIAGGGMLCTVKETTSARFDSTAFKKAHPELVSEYTKSTTSTTYEIKNIKEREFDIDAVI